MSRDHPISGADYLRAMKTDCKRQNKDLEALKAEVEELNVQVA
jgi:hypothetical protein